MYSDALIGAKIKTIFDDEHGLYGAKRIAASLKEDTTYTPVNHKKVARIMKSMGWGCPQIVDTLLSCLGVKQRFSYYNFDQRAGLRNRRGLPSRWT
ncbi:IS3 family transposase, partial [Corynebacterium macginleyi]|nr:IS3 family transposase [Corynebacterium macginleyi]